MAAIEPHTSRPVPLGAVTTHRVVSTVDRAWRLVRNWWLSRRTAQMLATLSDAELADIGLHRGDIETALRALRRRV